MRRPILIILGAAAGALLVAGIGASAHSAFSPAHQVVLTNAGTDRPEPADTPEAAATAEPAEAPKAPAAAEPADTDNETDDDTPKTTTAPAPAPVQLESGVMQGGGREKSGGGGGGLGA